MNQEEQKEEELGSKKGLFKKFKSAASKMLIGSGTSQEQRQSELMKKGIFGCDLDKRGVEFVEELCSYLKNPENQVEGLFRISGSSSALKYFRATIEAGKTPNFIPVEDAHNVASLLKMFLRELPRPLISLQAPKESLGDLEQRIINALLDVMCTVDANKEITLMDLPNLALILGPNLVWDESGREESFAASADSSQILLNMAEDKNHSLNEKKSFADEEEYCILNDNFLNKDILSESGNFSSEAKNENSESCNNEFIEEKVDMKMIWEEIRRLRNDLEEERIERMQLANLILPQLEKTQLDLIEALKSLKIGGIEENSTNEIKEKPLKQKDEFGLVDSEQGEF